MHWSGSVGGCLTGVSLGGRGGSIPCCHTVSYSVRKCHTVSGSVIQCHTVSYSVSSITRSGYTLHVGELTLSGEGVGCGDGEGGWSGGTLDNTMATHVP